MGEVVLITGVSGLVGHRLARRLVAKDHKVRGASRHPDGLAGEPIQAVAMPSPGAGQAEWRALLEGVDHVVHCAAVAGADRSIPEAEYMEANVRLTSELARAAAATIAGTFVHLSSIRVFGTSSDAVVTEASPPAPSDGYGRSKLESERAVRAAFPEGGHYTILRPAPIYGPGAGGLCAALASLARLPLPLPFASLAARYSLLDLEACCGAIEHALFGMVAEGGTYTVCDADALTIADFVSAVRRGRGRSAMLFPISPPILSFLLRAAGRDLVQERLSGRLVADCSALAAKGWEPVDDTAKRLEDLGRAEKAGDAN